MGLIAMPLKSSQFNGSLIPTAHLQGQALQLQPEAVEMCLGAQTKQFGYYNRQNGMRFDQMFSHKAISVSGARPILSFEMILVTSSVVKKYSHWSLENRSNQAARHSMSADLYFTSVSFFFLLLLSSFFRRLISEVAERNSTKIGHMVGSKCNLKTHI